MRDLRYAVRILRKNPGFTTAAVLTLALGIGLNATIFSIFDAMALRPVSLPAGTPALTIYQDIRGEFPRDVIGGPSLFAFPEYREYQENNHVFTGITAYTPEFRALVDADVRPVPGQLTTCNYFTVLGVSPAKGRGFLPNECGANDVGPVVVLSEAFWRSHFAADANVIGKTLKLNRIPLTVVGVAPPGFGGTEIVAASFWVPLSMQWSLAGRTDTRPFVAREDLSWLALIGRVKPGVTSDRARADLAVIAGRRDTRFKNRVTTLSLGEPNFFGRPDKHRAIIAIGAVFLAAVGLVLLVACANVANLFLARAAARQREIAIRLAIGASRIQLVRQLLVESSVIAIAGGILGTAVASRSAAALVSFLLRDPDTAPMTIVVGPDVRVFAYSLLLVVVAVLTFGFVPALQATRLDMNAMMRSGGEIGGSRGRLRGYLVGMQVAVSTVLLIAAGLLLRSVASAESAAPGFVVDHALTMTVDLHAEGYTPRRAAAFHREIGASLKMLPGVVAVSQAATAPLGGRHHISPFGVPGDDRRQPLEFNQVTPEFFASTGIPLARGRDFAQSDIGGHFAIVSEAASRLFWPGQDPIGKTLLGERPYTVIGVARDAEVGELGQSHEPYLYLSATDSDAFDLGTVIVRSSASDASVAGALRRAALALDPDLHVKVAPLRDNLRPYVQASQFLATLSSALAGLALLLASLGIYGTVAFVVARRTREIGIRLALGAEARSVIALVTLQSMRPVVIAAAVGLGVSALVTRVLERVLFGVSALDVVAFVGVPAFLLGVALLASYIPARRAARVDPLVALRVE